ncbi:hypothetical protein IW261DRAFT_1611289 [Armillaria novae-zelandiae]|uniref:Heterokaryon incompatibility domain-containing protein n=1 Tax=Armillaria novae-zelandiae TaxID=153914 RepID=A0AA39NX69_9AGAR|nr:hypothetical protein IW261DRAFT_1611289 [Armillaria novae-zelandiae]
MNNLDDDRDNDWDVEREGEANEDEESKDEEMGDEENEWVSPPPEEYPEVTISAFTETGQEESSIVVPLQRAYTDRKPVITSRLADTPCATLGVQGLMDQLNTTLRTSYSLDNPFISSFLEDCIKDGYDFGMAYSYFRGILRYTDDWSIVQYALSHRRSGADEQRRKAVVGNRIINSLFPPRRVWDLYSNRVVPQWLMPTHLRNYTCLERLRPISHAWMDEEDRTSVWTPINRIRMACSHPKGCRPQPDPHRDAKSWQTGVCYLSGLGRPLTLKEGNLESDRSWFRRAWTLQEVGAEKVIAGDTPDGPLHAECKDGEQLQHTRYSFWLHRVLPEMQDRVSTNPVDKIAGLAFLIWTKVNTSILRERVSRGRMDSAREFDGYVASGDVVMTKPLLSYRTVGYVDRDETVDEDWCNMECVEGFVRGLAVVNEGDRQGEFIVECNDAISRFKIAAAHTYPILEETYTLIYYFCDAPPHACVVGRSLPGGRFEKMSVLETYDENLRDLTEKRRYILI